MPEITTLRESFRDVTDIDGEPCRLGASTFRYSNKDGHNILRYHKTNIIITRTTEEGEWVAILNSGGHRTVSTKNRLNKYLSRYKIKQIAGEWHISWKETGDRMGKFYDGITLLGDRILESSEPTAEQIENRIEMDVFDRIDYQVVNLRTNKAEALLSIDPKNTIASLMQKRDLFDKNILRRGVDYEIKFSSEGHPIITEDVLGPVLLLKAVRCSYDQSG